MKKTIILFIAMGICSITIAQRLKVMTYNQSDYREHYTYILDAATNNGTPTVYIAGNPTDKPTNNARITAHKIVGQSLLSNKEGLTNSVPNDKFMLTDFTVQPSVDIRYGAERVFIIPTDPQATAIPFWVCTTKAPCRYRVSSISTFPMPAMSLHMQPACGSNTLGKKRRITFAA